MAAEGFNVTNHPARDGIIREVAERIIAHGGGGGHIGGMNDRLAKLEGSFDGIKQSQAILKAGVVGVGAIIVGAVALIATLQLWTVSRLDALPDKINAEIGAVQSTLRAEFAAMRAESAAQTSAIANSITATKQQAPQVILVPAPQVVPSPPQPAPETPTEPPPKQ